MTTSTKALFGELNLLHTLCTWLVGSGHNGILITAHSKFPANCGGNSLKNALKKNIIQKMTQQKGKHYYLQLQQKSEKLASTSFSSVH